MNLRARILEHIKGEIETLTEKDFNIEIIDNRPIPTELPEIIISEAPRFTGFLLLTNWNIEKS